MVDRRFWVTNGRRADLELTFGTGGVWTRLLYKADGYMGTEVWCEVPPVRRYRVRDFWAWHRDFEKYRSRRQSEYERFKTRLMSDGLIEKEQLLGAYYEDLPGDEEDSVLT